MANIRFVNRGPKRGEIWLYDVVGEGFFGGMSAKTFQQQLKALGQVETIDLRINSPGGSVFEGVAIYNQLKSHPAQIEVNVDGVAASIASVIAMAGDTINVADNAMLMIHDPYGFASGNAEEMRKTAELLDQIKGVVVATYARRTGNSEADLANWMAEETWFTASDAVRHGFADAVTAEQKIAACSGFDFSSFKRTPARLTAQTRSAGHSIAQVRLAAMESRMRS